jgi:Zn-dependent metalloprotease
MKNLIVALVVSISFPCLSQGLIKEPIIVKDQFGNIKSVEFPDGVESSKIPVDHLKFFNEYLKIQTGDEFNKVPQNQKEKGFTHEHFNQLYYGIKIDGAGYNFHYKDGIMFLAHGTYVRINDLNTIPAISSEQAKKCFIEYKKIPTDSVTDFISELIIKEITLGSVKYSLLSDHWFLNISFLTMMM